MRHEEMEEIEKEDKEPPYTKNLDKNLQLIRDRITELRMKEGISERALSLDLDRGPAYIGQVTNGIIKPSLVPLLQICERFELEPKEFFDVELHSPSLVHEAVNLIKRLDDEDIIHLIALLKKLGGKESEME